MNLADLSKTLSDLTHEEISGLLFKIRKERTIAIIPLKKTPAKKRTKRTLPKTKEANKAALKELMKGMSKEEINKLLGID